jgi:hypothetical protein
MDAGGVGSCCAKLYLRDVGGWKYVWHSSVLLKIQPLFGCHNMSKLSAITRLGTKEEQLGSRLTRK